VKEPKWASTCFAHVWYLLSSCSGVDLDVVISSLPWSVRYWWHHSRAALTEDVRMKMLPSTGANKCVKPVFQDVTHVRNKLLERLHGSDIRGRDIIRLLGKHCVPNIICPMGCLMFPDDDAQMIGYQHLYASMLSVDYSHFRAKKSTFVGAYPDWPCEGTFLKKPIAAGLYVSSDGGVCFLHNS
jgi:hypothetical protein